MTCPVIPKLAIVTRSLLALVAPSSPKSADFPRLTWCPLACPPRTSDKPWSAIPLAAELPPGAVTTGPDSFSTSLVTLWSFLSFKNHVGPKKEVPFCHQSQKILSLRLRYLMDNPILVPGSRLLAASSAWLADRDLEDRNRRVNKII